MVEELNNYEQKLLSGWEEVYKRGQLTLWIMLALQDGPKHMSSIKEYIDKQSKGVVGADDQSMYRALRRYHETELVTFTSQQVPNGPDRKIYELTDVGKHVLEHFIVRNFAGLINQPIFKQLNKESS